MNDLASVLNALRRPKILIRAARAGVVDYRRERDLRRLLRQVRNAGGPQTMGTLLAEESRLECTRTAGEATYSIQRHVAVLTAILAEARLMGGTAIRPEKGEPGRKAGVSLAYARLRGQIRQVTGRLIVASNRTATPGELRAGGLALALGDALAERGGVWFGWSGEVVDRETRGLRLFAEGNVEFALADLTRSEYDGYYLGYSNRALWPVFHYRVDLAHFDESEFEAYEVVNRRFGRLLAQQLREDDVVWVHDYHFLLMGAELRASGWQGLTGFFLHIPFPAPEVFSSIPQHQRLARGLCAFDLVGFQTRGDAANFRRYLVENAGAVELEDGRLQAFDRTLSVETFSIGIDVDDIAASAIGEEGRSAANRLGRIIENRALVIGVDRMDYSKGLPQRIEAFGRMLDDHEDLRGQVSFLQIAPPSREAVDAYQALREELDRLAGKFNADYADLDWVPIRYLARSYSREVLSGLFRIARVGMVTPLRDGMNLVAKEYVAAQDEEDPGALVLSEFAGAADQMQAALLVNPHDISAMADTIHRALTMSLEERRERWRELIRSVREEDISWWRRRFLSALESVRVEA